MMDANRTIMQRPESTSPIATRRPLSQVRPFQAHPSFSIESPSSKYKSRKAEPNERHSSSTFSSPSPGRQPPIGHASRFYNHQDQNRLPYSAALLGANTVVKEENGTIVESSSSLATQAEPPSSSVNGDAPVKKCGTTNAVSTHFIAESDEGLWLYIANLPVVTINTPLERVRADLYAHLSTLAKIDNLKIRHGKLLRGHPHGARQLLAFAYFSIVEEARKLLSSPVSYFMGCPLRVEVTHNQRTLIVTTHKDYITLEPLQAMSPWADNKSRFPLLYQARNHIHAPFLSRMLIRELCAAFGLVTRLHTEKAPFEVLFSDFESCRRAKQAFDQVKDLTGIVVSHPQDIGGGGQLMSLRSESDFDLSSDCLPNTTSSSSPFFDPNMTTKEELDNSNNTISNHVQLVQTNRIETGLARPSPLTDNMPLTPILAVNQEQKESERGVSEKNPSPLPQIPFREESSPKKKTEAMRGYRQARQCDIDPCSIFVSRLPAIDNIEEALQRHFSPDGPIKNCRVMSSKANPGNKFAFVNFEDAPSAQKALLRHGQFFMGKSMIIRPREYTPPNLHHRSQYDPKTSLTVNVGVEAVKKRHGDESGNGVLPSTTIQFGSCATSPQRSAELASVLDSPNQQRDANLPDRPSSWSPTRSIKTTSPSLKNPHDHEFGVEYPISLPKSLAQPSLEQNYPNSLHDTTPIQSVEAQQWPAAPLSPISMSTQPTTATQSPTSPIDCFGLSPICPIPSDQQGDIDSLTKAQHMNGDQSASQWLPNGNGLSQQGGEAMMLAGPPFMQGECGSPYWPVITVDAYGQRYVVHPVGSCCPPIGPDGGHFMQQQQQQQQQQQLHHHTPPPPPFQDKHEHGGQGNRQVFSDNEKTIQEDRYYDKLCSNGAPLMRVPFGMPFPVFDQPFPIAAHGIAPIDNASPPWLMPHLPFPEQGVASTRRSIGQDEQNVFSVHESLLRGNAGPIQIPAWMNDSN